MLLTVTPNPAIDRTLHVPELHVGAVNRAVKVDLAAGGKGLNAARAARARGDAVLATAPLAGHTGRLLAELAAAEGFPADWFWLESGLTRTCVLLNHRETDTTVINEPGQPISEKGWHGFVAHVKRLAARAKAVTFSGSLPPRVEAKAYVDFIHAIARSGRPVYVDSSGVALDAVIARPAGVCLKINQAELAGGLETQLDNLEQTLEAGKQVLARGAAMVVVTLGGAGALAMGAGEAWLAHAPPVAVVSTVGSGDAFLAGLALAGIAGQPLQEALQLGVAYGSANATTPLPGRFGAEVVAALLPQIAVERLA